MAHPATRHPAAVPALTVDFTDVIDALVSPIHVDAAPIPAPDDQVAGRVHLRPVAPADQRLPAHHDTVVPGAMAGELVLMDDFAGELRRWLSTPQ
ncbi:MAG: hypothetical protein R2710_18590 [Acidimicrobiales bacterium]